VGSTGTGKSEFARFLAQRMGRNARLVCYSDLASQFVGQTEKQIRALFDEADSKGDFIVIGEVNSLLRSRAGSHFSWEVTQVNEPLLHLDRSTASLAFTTNDLPGIDAAVMRRIDLKIGFLPPDRTGLFDAFAHFFGQPALSSSDMRATASGLYANWIARHRSSQTPNAAARSLGFRRCEGKFAPRAFGRLQHPRPAAGV
jgi:transitional endoplasmic reticulum ATPase